MKLLQLTNSYLDHIRIAVEAGDVGAPFRDFIDNWAAYTSEVDHHRTASNRVIWFNNPDAIRRRDMLLSLPFRSAGADEILRYADEWPEEYKERRRAKDRDIKLIVDHAVPLATIVASFFESGADLSRSGVRTQLQSLYYLGILSDAEDARLNGLGLRSRMPHDWDGRDLIARYRLAGIPAVGQVAT